MKTIALVMLMMTVTAFGQNAPFIEVGQTYLVAGDQNITDLLMEQDLVIEVDAVAGDWIRIYIERGDVYAWLNTNQLSLLVEVDLEEIAVTRLSTCLREVSTAQEIYFIDNFTYADHETLLEPYGQLEACEGVELETVEVSENDYLIVGSLGDLSYQVSASGLIELTRVETAAEMRLVDCLREVSTLQEINFIDNDTYTDHEALFESYDGPEACADVGLETVEVTESDYLVVGSIGQLSYQATPRRGVQPTR